MTVDQIYCDNVASWIESYYTEKAVDGATILALVSASTRLKRLMRDVSEEDFAAEFCNLLGIHP